MNKDYARTSIIAEYIDGLLQEKRALGFSYVFEEYLLNVFDHYCVEKDLKGACFDRDFLNDWLSAWKGEGSSYHSQRISFVRQLALYMNSLGIHAYIPVESVKKETIIPHVLSAEERLSFFKALDAETPKVNCSYAWRMWNEYRVMFRLLYCCGMRNSEVRRLKTEDVNLEEGILTIFHSKGDKDRLVYLADDVRELLCQYRNHLTDDLGYLPSWFFPSRFTEKPVHKSTLDYRFNLTWNKTPFSGIYGKKPTVHSLRHSFVVDRMNSWLEEGLTYDMVLPCLSKYLGHSGNRESMYYYHLDEKANTLIRMKDRTAGRVIPGVEKYGY